MPFVALNPLGQRICALDEGDLREQYKPGDFTCPFCGGDMNYRRGRFMRPHFAHKVDCTSEFERKPESEEHLAAKAKIRELLAKKYAGHVVDLEVPLPSVRRIADVMVNVNGWMEIHEIQLSPITLEVFEERTADYEKEGAQVYWWLGERVATPPIKKWCREKFGAVHLVEFRDAH